MSCACLMQTLIKVAISESSHSLKKPQYGVCFEPSRTYSHVPTLLYWPTSYSNTGGLMICIAPAERVLSGTCGCLCQCCSNGCHVRSDKAATHSSYCV